MKISMTRKQQIILGLVMIGLLALAFAAARAQDAPRVTTGFVSRLLCSATFVSGLDPDRVYAETLDAMPGVGLIGWALDYRIDRSRREVTTTVLRGAESRAVYRDGLGCRMAAGDDSSDDADVVVPQVAPLPRPDIAAGPPVETTNPELARALDRAFAEMPDQPQRHTKAIVVLQDSRIIAERYAPGIGIDTPLLGWSATKSVVNALIGILVREGKLAADQPAPIAAWRDLSDPHHAITVDELLRHTSGLAMGSSLKASLASALAPVNRMKFIARDMAGYAEHIGLESAPGAAWNYHDGNFIILSRLIRDAAGGHAADVLRFARHELFDPLGMRDVTMEFDATGTPEGSSQMLAPARSWARLGQLYLDDGVVGGARILPQGWVDYSKAPTPNAWVGYGAGFWTNLGDSYGASYRGEHGWPKDAFYASGSFGQYVIVLPSQHLVIVRFGVSGNRGDIEGVSHLVADVIAATRDERSAQLLRGMR